MSILSGFFKTKKYRKTSDGYKLQSLWTSSQTVEMNDGNTAETNLGAIKGITSSLASTSSNYALSASAGKNLQDQVSTLNTNLSALNDITIIDLSSWDRNHLQNAYQYIFRLNAKQKQCNVCGTMTFANVPIGEGLFTVPQSIKAVHGAFLIGHSLSGNTCIIKIPAANETDQIAVAYGMQIVADTYFFNDIYFTA